MRIAIVLRSLKFGGMERAACNQADAFFQAGHDVDLIYFSNKRKEIAPSEAGVNLVFLDINKLMKKEVFGFAWNIVSKLMNMIFRGTYSLFKGMYLSKVFERALAKLEEDKPYDLILIRGQGSFEQIWRYKNPKCVRICVNVSTKETSSLKDKLISKAYFENCHVNCNSEGGASFYEAKFKREEITPLSLKAIRNPFFKERIVRLSNEENSEIPREPYILGVGRLVEAKNFDLMINTYIHLKQHNAFAYKLVIVGDGSQKQHLEQKVKDNNLQDDVIFAGYQKNPYNWMKQSEAFLLTSRFEGLCGVLIEAMCCQTRIVASESPGGVRELMAGERLEENLVKPDSVFLAQQLLIALNNPKEYYFKDYEKTLSSLEPQTVVKKWLEYVK